MITFHLKNYRTASLMRSKFSCWYYFGRFKYKTCTVYRLGPLMLTVDAKHRTGPREQPYDNEHPHDPPEFGKSPYE